MESRESGILGVGGSASARLPRRWRGTSLTIYKAAFDLRKEDFSLHIAWYFVSDAKKIVNGAAEEQYATPPDGATAR